MTGLFRSLYSTFFALVIVVSVEGATKKIKRDCSWSLLSHLGELLGLAEPPDELVDSIGKRKPSERELPPPPPKTEVVEPVKDRKTSRSPVYDLKIVKEIQQKAAENTREAEIVREFLVFTRVRKLVENYASVALLFGNPENKIKGEETALLPEYTKLVAGLKEKNIILLYDLDSKSGRFLHEMTGEMGIGITSQASTLPGTIQITNPFLKFELFESAKEVVASPNSLLGMGLILNGQKTIHVLTQSQVPALSHKTWRKSLLFNLGLRLEYEQTLIHSANGFIAPSSYKHPTKPFDLSVEKTISQATMYKLEQMLKASDCLAMGEKRLEWDETEERKIPGGAVILGSSSNHSDYTELVYQSARKIAQRGIPVVTGGSGGYMGVANMAAFDAGGDSIGIPLTGSFRLESEKTVASGFHTLTVGSMGYPTRIPLLLHKRRLIVAAPGGSGTMREMAAVFAQLASGGESPDLVFLSKKYYGNLFDQLKTALPDYLKAKIHLVDAPQDWDPLLDQIEASQTNISDLKTSASPQPRNERQAFPVTWEPKETSKSESDRKDYSWLW